MMMLDREIDSAQALVIDGNPTSRSIIAAQLRELGVSQVAQVSRLADGRKRLEARRYDIVVCEQQFPGDDQTGQELLDDLRRENLLPYGTVFIMITGEARYEHVAEAAESALDSYLLKPYSASTLAERLRQARHRKRSLGRIFGAIEADDIETAAQLCLDRFTERGEFWLYAARIGAELMLRMNRHEDAQALFAAIIDAKAVPWAKLGVARAQVDGGQVNQARRTLEVLINADPSYADAYDVMGRVQIEQGNLDEALETYRRAAEITPGSISRLQKQGMLAFYLGQDEEAERLLDRATLIGITSKTYDWQTLVLLGFARFRLKDAKGLQRSRENLEHVATRAPDNVRLSRFCRVVRTLEHLLAKRLAAAVSEVGTLAAERRAPDFDIEAACNMLSLLATLAANELLLDDMERWVTELAIRYATSRSVTELLSRAAAPHPPFAALISQGHAQVQSRSEKAMAHALDDRHGDSVRALLQAAEETLNAKLVDTAKRTLHRYRDRVPDAAQLDARIEALRERYADSWAAPRLGQGARAAGGLTLRDGSPAAATLAREQAAPQPAAAAAATGDAEDLPPAPFDLTTPLPDPLPPAGGATSDRGAPEARAGATPAELRPKADNLPETGEPAPARARAA